MRGSIAMADWYACALVEKSPASRCATAALKAFTAADGI
jgi:hypothetical protein